MPEQAPDSSESTSDSSPSHPPEPAPQNRTVRVGAGQGGSTVLGESEDRGVRVGGAGAGSEKGGLTRTLVLDRLVGGATLLEVARDLGLHRSTVQQHRDSLLAAGAIVKSARPPGWFHSKGPTYELETTRLHTNARAGQTALLRNSDRPAPAPTNLWQATDGSRRFELLAPPSKHPTELPGFVGTALSGAGDPMRKRRDHRMAWVNDGRTFDLLLMEVPKPKQGHGWSLQLKKVRPPPFYTELLATPDEDFEVAWDRFVFESVHLWGQLGGVPVSPDRSKVRRSRRVAPAMVGVMPPDIKFRSENAEADDTPEERTLEVMREDYRRAIEVLPQFEASTAEELGRLRRELVAMGPRLDGLDGVLVEAVAVQRKVGRIVDLLAVGQAQLTKASAALVAGQVAPPLPSSSLPGVEYS